LRWIDVMNEVAFLAMDLHAANRADLARRFLNTYLEFSRNYGGLRLGVRFGAVLSKRAMNCTPKFRRGHRFFQSRAKTSHIASQVHPC
jgi:hypothetical protein